MKINQEKQRHTVQTKITAINTVQKNSGQIYLLKTLAGNFSNFKSIWDA